VSIVWPRATDDPPFRAFRGGTWLKLKAEASDPDGTVAQVQFFADNGLGTKLIGVVTNPPFNLVWLYDGFVPAKVDLTVVAVDKLSASTESAPLRTFFGDGAGFDSAVEIVSPSSGTLFAAPATFQFKAELLATTYRLAIYPVEFFVGTNSVGFGDQSGEFTATTPPVSVTVSNLAEGQYDLTVRYTNDGSCACYFRTNTIQVVKLGINLPTLTTNGDLQFDVVTSFAGQPNLIQASTNLVDWVSIRTNVPAGNSFIFTVPLGATSARRFYRAWAPP